MAIFEDVQIQCGENIDTNNSLYKMICKSSEGQRFRELLKHDPDPLIEFIFNGTLESSGQRYKYHNQYLESIKEMKEISKYLETIKPNIVLHNFLMSINRQHKQEKRMLYCGSIEDQFIAKKAWLWQIIEFSYEYDADIIKMVDNSYLIQNNAFDDSQAMTEIQYLVEEINRYNRAVLIFNLDEISNIKKEYSALKEQPSHPSTYSLYGGNNQASFRYTMQRPQALELVLSLIKNQQRSSNVWYIAVAQDQKLAMDFIEATDWKKPRSVQDFETKEKELDEQRLCTRCGQYFTQRQNNLDFRCKRHSKLDIVMLETSHQDREKITMEKAKQLLSDPQSEVYPFDIKYLCCGQSLSSRGGEISTKHTIQSDPYSVL